MNGEALPFLHCPDIELAWKQRHTFDDLCIRHHPAQPCRCTSVCTRVESDEGEDLHQVVDDTTHKKNGGTESDEGEDLHHSLIVQHTKRTTDSSSSSVTNIPNRQNFSV